MSELSVDTFIEALTNREMDVLSLLAEGFSNQEIAESLVMEVGTIKWYNTQIYDKLHVKNRKQAVTRARTLGILEPDTSDPLQRLQHNLPADTLPFIGRDREIADLVEKLIGETVRLITILGPGGMGKSRLSIEVGRRLIGYFLDGVYFVPLASVTSFEQVVTTLAEVIGFKFHSDVHPKQQILDYLQQQHMLLIMDNFEHLLNHAGLLTDILRAAPKVSILATSRERLGLSGEVVTVISGLSTPFDENREVGAHDAVKLFVEAANRTTSPVDDDDMDIVAHICQMVGGMPLAIWLAAVWLDTLSLDEIAAEIRSGLDILQATLRDAPPRHQSIEAVFDTSWKRLTPHQQSVFMSLSVFREGFTREAAQAVSGASLRDVQHLVHTSFIQHLPSGRYAVHELMRQYGEHKLAESGELTSIREKHAHYFADLFKPVGEAGWMFVEPETLETVSPDFENMRAAWFFHQERKDVIQLRQVLDGIWVFLDMYSRSQEAIDLFENVLDVFRAEDNTEDSDDIQVFRGKLVALLGWFYGDIGQKPRALHLSKEALAMLQPLGPTDALLVAYAGHSMLLRTANVLQSAREEALKGLELARALDDSRWKNIFCLVICVVCAETEDYQEILEWAELMPEAIQNGPKAVALNHLGEYLQAREYLIWGLGRVRHHRSTRTFQHWELMLNALQQGNPEQAWSYLQRGLQYVDDTAYAWLALECLQNALELFISEQQYSMALEVLSLILHHPDTMDNTRAKAAKYEDVLRVNLSAQDFSAAWENGQQLDLGDLLTDLMER
jgi:predicted ATPase/DNA-binding CsgD family transcriptional regulator